MSSLQHTGTEKKPSLTPGPKSRYIPALDGLRALAVLAVIAYHTKMPWAIGGLLGVTVFFVLSGYLITSLLLVEYDNTSKIDLPQFWLRRIRRLVPAIVFVIACTAALCTLLDHSMLTKMRDEVVPSLFFYNNWWQIFHDTSYFEALGAPSPLTHFWSLAIEEQFYLIWPVILFLGLRKGVKRSTLCTATLVIALLSAIEMAILYNPSIDPSRVYYGTDTRAFSLLIGAWLAFVWPSHLLGAKSGVQLGRKERLVFDGIGIGSLLGLLVLIAVTDGFSPFLYRGGILLASILTAVVIAVVVHPASLLGRAAGIAPLVWIGKRSYGIYLWHFPLLLLMNPRTFTGETPWWLSLIQVAVVFACAAFSYRFIENPIRHGAIGQLAKGIRSGTVSIPRWLQSHALSSVAMALVALVALGGLILVPPTSAVEGANLLQQEEPHRSQNLDAPPSSSLPGLAEEGSEKPKLDVLMIGDSISVRTVPDFEKMFPHGAIDAAVNRQLYDGGSIYDHYAEQNLVGSVVVFALGTNGPATDAQLDDLIADVGNDKHIFLVNTRSPQNWVQTTNDALTAAADRHDNVNLIDWHEQSSGHDEYFDGDGTHLTEDGSVAYLNLIRDAVAPLLPIHEDPLDPAAAEPATEAVLA